MITKRMTVVHRTTYNLGASPHKNGQGWNHYYYSAWGQGYPKSAVFYVDVDHVVMRGSRWRMALNHGAMYHYPFSIFERLITKIKNRVEEIEISRKPVAIMRTKFVINDPYIINGSLFRNGFMWLMTRIFYEAMDRKASYSDAEAPRFGSEDHFHKNALYVLDDSDFYSGAIWRKGNFGNYCFYTKNGTLIGANLNALPARRRNAAFGILVELNNAKDIRLLEIKQASTSKRTRGKA